MWLLRPACRQNRLRIVYTGSDLSHPFHLRFATRKHGSYCAKPTRIRSGLVRVWPNTSGQETSRCAGIIVPGFWKDATSPLPVSHLLTPFRSSTDVPDNIVQSQPGSVLVLADSIGFWPNGSGPEESQCVRIIRPASGQCFPADPDRMRIGPDMFAGISIVLAWWCRHF